MYVRDYANPSRNDPYFMFTRNKDWFTWHSWAAGLYEFADNRNQESTSEGINAYYAVSLLGKASNNKNLDDFGRLLTAMEVISTKAYWQMPTYNTVYPEKFRKNLMVGILWSTKVEYSTFFGGNAEFIHGIQFLPFTPMTEEYLDKNFMKVKVFQESFFFN
jgi:endo-1,3(4)-beta-glucanase